ncbi:hypothetical protein DPMN_138225 [Dreissena polymorpha]|uniref:Secreted protein n=1 Tax=Dreissena polymorpha TaxID=45954 RepID=A0A9D4G3E4_DREPO|nr:hypothetical protein DPMN_138225 [Dreissena polymorpha]
MLLHMQKMFLFMNIFLATVAREPACPACSRYDFEERLLERDLRNELVIETSPLAVFIYISMLCWSFNIC